MDLARGNVSAELYGLLLQVRNKYSDQYEYDQITTLLGMDKTDSLFAQETKSTLLPELWVFLTVTQR